MAPRRLDWPHEGSEEGLAEGWIGSTKGYVAEDGVLAVEVSLADRTDYILSAPDATERTCGSITLAGRFGCLSVAADGRPLRAYLLDGTRLACGDLECALPCGHTHLPVASVTDRTLRLARPVPDDLRSFTECVLVGGTGYDVEEISGDVIRVPERFF